MDGVIMHNKRESIYDARFWMPDKIPHYLNVWLFKTNYVTGSGKYISVQANPSGVTLRIVVSGQWHISTRGKDYQARRGDLFLACPGEKIIFGQSLCETDWEWLEIQLNGSQAAQFAGQFGLSLDNAVITSQAPEKCIELFKALHEYMA
ncbi:MAG: AraC family ligand binding domain-containing protein, partial [Victivallales bacterium]|nr:AraC family ligand binding domain-containing protein [Victivallales bacterium]